MIKIAVAGLVLALSYSYFSRKQELRPILPIERLNVSYDYVIVGAGSAGSVLAARLSERPDVSVLLLEAGGYHDEIDTSHVPGLWAKMLHTHFDWEYYTQPQEDACLGQINRQAYWPRGKTLGGSSVINLLQYTRGNPLDFNNWEKMGCKGWGYKDVLPYFKKSEDILVADLADSKYHSKGGPMGVSDGILTKLHDLYLQAGQEMGYSLTDYNSPEQEGFSSYQLHVRNGERVSTSKSYLDPILDRPNLHVAIRSYVTKIELRDKKATGVFVVRENRKYFIKANKEVIVSAGAINSPQLLLLSGIGPRQHLEEVGIPVVADLPVGKNLQDHARLLTFTSIEKPLSIVAGTRTSLWNRLKYRLFGSGPLGKTVAEATAFLYTDKNNRDKQGTNLQMNFFSSIGEVNNINVIDKLHQEINRKKKKYGFTAILIMNHLKSNGTIKLKSSDPYEYPLIDPKYLSVKSDLDDFIKAIRIWETFVQTPTIQALGADTEHMKVSVCSDHDFRSDAYWECYVRHFITTTYHPCCTCKMGATADPGTVVDPKLRVKGVKNLRVVDASVFPEETSGNLNAPVIMIAEKAADMILQRK